MNVLVSVDELIDALRGAERIRPDTHLERVLQVVISELEHLLQGVILIKLNRVGDLGKSNWVWVLSLLENLVEMVVNGVRNSLILTLVAITGAEVKALNGSGIVELEEL